MDKMSRANSPVLHLHGRDQFNTIIIALCIRSGCAICPVVTHIYASLAERPGRVCVMKVTWGHRQTTYTHSNPCTGHGTYHPAARLLSLLWFELRPTRAILFGFRTESSGFLFGFLNLGFRV